MSNDPAIPPLEAVQSAAPKQGVLPAQHVAPAAHAQPPAGLDPAAVAAVNEERGRDAVEHVEGVKPGVPPRAVHVAEPLHRVQVTAAAAARLHGNTWELLRKLARAREHEIAELLESHPAAARQLAEAFVRSGGVGALEHWREAHDTGSGRPNAGPQPERPYDEEHAGVSLAHGPQPYGKKP